MAYIMVSNTTVECQTSFRDIKNNSGPRIDSYCASSMAFMYSDFSLFCKQCIVF